MPTEIEAFRKLMREKPELKAALSKAINDGRLKDPSTINPDDELIIVVGPDHSQVEGSKQVKCECGAVGWLSPSSQELIEARKGFPTRIMCMSCVMKEVPKP